MTNISPREIYPELTVTARDIYDGGPGTVHDDETARANGFERAIVVGQTTYGYMSELAVAHWGTEWIERGTMSAKYIRPVFNADVLTISSAPDADAANALKLEVRNEALTVVAVGRIALPDDAASILGPVHVDRAQAAIAPIKVPDPAVHAGYQLGGFDVAVSLDEVVDYLDRIGSTARDLYLDGQLVPPSLLAWVATKVQIRQLDSQFANVGVACAHRQFVGARIGASLRVTGAVSRIYEKNGHEMWDVDFVIASDEGATVSEIRKTSIYRLADAHSEENGASK